MCKKYEFNIRKFKRGQVWLCTEDQNVTNALRAANIKALNGTRPYLIISVNGSMLSCVPMTTNTSGRDTRDNDVVFTNPDTQIESRIVISEICTKGSNEMTKYLYSFSDEDTRLLVDLTRAAIFDTNDTYVKRKDESKDIPDEVEKEVEPAATDKKDENASEDLMTKMLDERLTKRKKKTDPLFLTAQEAALWLNRWGNEKVYVVAKYYGIPSERVYSWKHLAKSKIKEG